MNGLIRHYVSKGSSLEGHSAEFILAKQELFNNRPRKSIGYLTPKEFAFRKFDIAILEKQNGKLYL